MSGTAPYASALAAAQNQADLQQLWKRWTTDLALSETMVSLTQQGIDVVTPEALKLRMSNEWEARSAEIRLAMVTGPSEAQIVTARAKLAEIDDQSMQATQDYGTAVEAYAKAHANYKSTRARTYMKFKGEYAAAEQKLTDGMAETMADADEAVADLYFAAEMSEAKMKAAKALLDHLERSFQYHRSLMVREDRADSR